MVQDTNNFIKIEYSLVNHLKFLSENDIKYKDLYAIWVLDEKGYSNSLQAVTNTFPHYSMHDSSHSLSIINKIEMVLGKNRIQQLSATDTFLLLETAYVHDLGMIVTMNEERNLWKSIEFEKYLEDIISGSGDKDLVQAACCVKDIRNGKIKLEDDMPINIKNYVTILNADYFRKFHNERSAEYLKNPAYGEVLINHGRRIPERITNLIAQISIMHGTEFDDIINKLSWEDNGIATDRIHPRMVACLLRLGDLLDLDNGRFNETFVSSIFMPESSREQMEKHQSVTHFLVSPRRIEVSAICPNANIYRATRQWFDWLKDELKNLSCRWSDIVPEDFIGGPPSLGDIKLSINSDENITEQLDFKFQIDQRVAFEFIEGSGIYINKLDCIREIIQNALDATKLHIWMDLESGKYDYFKNCKSFKDKSKLNFSSDLPECLKDLYPLNVTLNYIENKEDLDGSEFEIIIEDSGCGINLFDLKRMESVGHSWSYDVEKYRLIQRMPEWMKPTGNFGIGIHSVFMVTDKIEIETKAENSNAYHIEFISSKNNGYINVGRSDKNIIGTQIRFRFNKKWVKKVRVYDEEYYKYSDLDIVDNDYETKKLNLRACCIIRSYLNNIKWLKINYKGIFEKYKFTNSEDIKKYDNLFTKHVSKNNLSISYELDIENKELVTIVQDAEDYTEYKLRFKNIINRRNNIYDLDDMINLGGKTRINRDDIRIFYKGIFCSSFLDFRGNFWYSSIFCVDININNEKAKKILSINRNRLDNDDFVKKIIDKLDKCIIPEITNGIIEYIKNKPQCKQYIENIDIYLMALYFNNKRADEDNIKNLQSEVCLEKYLVNDSFDIETQKEVSILKLLQAEKIICCEDKINIKDRQEELKDMSSTLLLCNTHLMNRWNGDYENLKAIGFSCCRIVSRNKYLLTKENTSLYYLIVDYKEDKSLIKYFLKELFSSSDDFIKMRPYIKGFEYVNKEDSQIKYLICEKGQNILSPFTKETPEDICEHSIDDIVVELKNKYMFNELIEYVYKNSYFKNELDNIGKDYKEVLEQAYKELIKDYIDYVYNTRKSDLKITEDKVEEAAVDENPRD